MPKTYAFSSSSLLSFIFSFILQYILLNYNIQLLNENFYQQKKPSSYDDFICLHVSLIITFGFQLVSEIQIYSSLENSPMLTFSSIYLETIRIVKSKKLFFFDISMIGCLIIPLYLICIVSKRL